MLRRRTLRPPVWSRLTWVWLLSGSLLTLAIGGVTYLKIFDNDPERIALEVGPVQTFAPPPNVHQAKTRGGYKLSKGLGRAIDQPPLPDQGPPVVNIPGE